MQVTFLGTGTSQGVPLIGCNCKVCNSSNPKDNRLRSSILIQKNNTTIIIDTGPDFRQQMLRIKNTQMDAVVFTHGHKDHVAGLDDIRAYNYILNKKIDVFADELTTQTLKTEFSYIFREDKYPGIPDIELHPIINNKKIIIKDMVLEPIQVMHYKLPVFGFRVDNFVYITDANFIAPEELIKIMDAEVLVINALRNEKHISHFSLEEAIALAKSVNAKKTYCTHISHQLGMHQQVSEKLPAGISLAYDGLVLDL